MWDAHVAHDDGSVLIYIDRQLSHEVTSPQAFEGLKLLTVALAVPANVATVDHNVPTENQIAGVEAIEDPTSRIQVQTLEANGRRRRYCHFFNERSSPGHRACDGAEQGATLPGMTVVCGDSYTSTHGAFGALAHGIAPAKSNTYWRHSVWWPRK